MLKVDTKGNKLNQEVMNLYNQCCDEMGVSHNRPHDEVSNAPSYQAYYEKSREFLSYITGKTKEEN